MLDDSDKSQLELERVNAAREDPRMVKLRADIVTGLEHAMDFWSTDAETADVSDLLSASHLNVAHCSKGVKRPFQSHYMSAG